MTYGRVPGVSKMPTGPRGERRPAEAVGAAIVVAPIATGQIVETPNPKSGRTRSGHASAAACAENLSARRRRQIAQKAAAARWKGKQ